MRWTALLALAAVAPAPAAESLGTLEYDYPRQARAIPKLNAWFQAQRVAERARLDASGRKELKEARREGLKYRPYWVMHDWEVVTDTPRFLSMSLGYRAEGAAHGHTSFDALVWDKAAGVRQKPASFFANPQALRAALRRPFCAAVDRQRAERRGVPVNRAGGDMFDECLDPAKVTMILGSSTRTRFDKIGFLLGSYEAGPYVEGTYEVTLPVTRAVIAAIRPAYRRYFRIRR